MYFFIQYHFNVSIFILKTRYLRTILNTLLLLSLFTICNGQVPFNNYKIGYYFDIKGQPIDGYFDCSYAPEKSLYVDYTYWDYFSPGYYYNRKGEKITGLLKYSPSGQDFRSGKNERNEIITTHNCLGFRIGIDSFAIIKNFDVEKDLFKLHRNRKKFALVIDKIDSLTFYGYIQNNSRQTDFTYLVKTDGSDNYISFSKNHDKFKKTATKIFHDFDALVEGIKDEKYTEDDIPSMIKMLKYKRYYERQRKVYFSKSWDETEKEDSAAFYAQIESLEDSVFHITYYFMNSVKIYEGDFTSLYPHKKMGEFVFYYPDGKVRKRITYQNNLPSALTDYFNNGNIHREYSFIKDSPGNKKHITYMQVYDISGNKLLDNKGNGAEKFSDPVNHRQVTYEYQNHALADAYYFDARGNKIFQFCEKNAKLRFRGILQLVVNHKIDYPDASVINNNHGKMLVRCIIQPSGKARDFKIIRSVDAHCDSIVKDFIMHYAYKFHWKAGTYHGEKIAQEVVIPFDFSLTNYISYYNNYNSYFYNSGWSQMYNPQISNSPPPQMPGHGF